MKEYQQIMLGAKSVYSEECYKNNCIGEYIKVAL